MSLITKDGKPFWETNVRNNRVVKTFVRTSNEKHKVINGEQHKDAKLTWVQVLVARARYNNRHKVPIRIVDLAAEYGVTYAPMSKAIRGDNWPDKNCPAIAKVEARQILQNKYNIHTDDA